MLRLNRLLVTLVMLLAIAGSAFAEPSFQLDEIVKLKGEALDEALERVKKSEGPMSELISVLEQLQKEIAKLPESDEQDPKKPVLRSLLRSDFDELLALACEKATPDHLEPLAKFFSSLPPDWGERYRTWPVIAALFMECELAKMRARAPHSVKLPKQSSSRFAARKVSAELASAIRLARGIVAPFEATEKAARKKFRHSFQNDETLYWQTFDAILTGGSGSPETILAFQWIASCGAGAEDWVGPTSSIVFLGLVYQQRFSEAAGAALSVSTCFDPYPYDPNYSQRFEFLELCGIDGVELIAGQLARMDLGKEALPFFFPRADLLKMIGRKPSQKGARYLMEIARETAPGIRSEYLRALSPFLQSSDSLRKEILHFLDEIYDARGSFNLATSIVELLNQLNHLDTIPLLKRLLRHPSRTVALPASKALQALGEAVEIPPLPGPLQFIIHVNGKPYSKRKLDLRLTSKNSSLSTGAETELDGRFTIDRDYLLDPARKISSVTLSPNTSSSLNEPLFAVVFPVQEDSETAKLIEVKTVPLEFRFAFPFESNSKPDEKMELLLKSISSGLTFYRSYQLPIAKKLQFAGIQPGEYEVTVSANGCAFYKTRFNTPANGIFDINLEPGTDVKMHIRCSFGIWDPNYLDRILLHNGKKIDWSDRADFSNNLIRGLPQGDYILTIRSSKEHKQLLPNSIPEGIDYGRFEQRFTINEESPAIIDLGEIVLPPPAKATKRR